MQVDQHFHKIETIVEDFKPKRVLFDSISTYGSNLGTEGRTFRDFFHALVALMKESQTAAIYNHENPEMLGMSSMMGEFGMSSLVDNIVLMNWIEIGDTFRLGLTVAKMRANPTVRTTFECEIVDGKGMRVLSNRLPSPLNRVPFSGYEGLISRNPARQAASAAGDSGKE
jgi:KaiC/GvpD/RAD55 family RecA-like ATPase